MTVLTRLKRVNADSSTNNAFLFHSPHYAKECDAVNKFPDLFGWVYKYAEDKRWNSESPLKEMFQRKKDKVDFSTSVVMPSMSTEE